MSFLSHTMSPLLYTILATPLGTMIAIAHERALVTLLFVDSLSEKMKQELELLKQKQQLIEGLNVPLQSIIEELRLYFLGKLTTFATPIEFSGTPFQKSVWHTLVNVAHGSTQSYTDLAIAVGDKKAVRAVAQANARNQFVIMVPCHRIIAKNGKLGGYSCGLQRKQWLLEFEKKRM